MIVDIQMAYPVAWLLNLWKREVTLCWTIGFSQWIKKATVMPAVVLSEPL
jgi:hypothetical protein